SAAPALVICASAPTHPLAICIRRCWRSSDSPLSGSVTARERWQGYSGVQGGQSGCLVLCLVAVCVLSAAGDQRLIYAAKQQDTAAVRALLQQHVEVNAAQADGATALHWAVHRSELEMVELLLRAGANANAANDLGVRPLSLACTNGNAAVVEQLLNA